MAKYPHTFDDLQAQVKITTKEQYTKGHKNNLCRIVSIAATIHAIVCLGQHAPAPPTLGVSITAAMTDRRESIGGRMILFVLSELARNLV